MRKLFMLLAILILGSAFVTAANPGHDAIAISAGTFEAGNFIFPNRLTVLESFIVNGSIFSVANTGVGIGTLSPTQLLDVNGSINISNSTGSLYSPQICLNGDCRTAWPVGGVSGGGGGGWTNYSTYTTTALIVNVTNSSGSSVLYIDTTNNTVGIGTTNPGYSLDVVSSAGNDGIRLGAANGQDRIILSTGGSSNGNGNLNLYDNSGTKRIALLPSTASNSYFNGGNLGIGTTNPNATLHVVGDINVTSGNDICIDGGNCLSGLSGLSSSSAGGWTNTSTLITSEAGVNISADSGVLFIDATNNRVGIGTTTPSSQFELYNSNTNAQLAVTSNTDNAYLKLESNVDGVGMEESGIILTNNGNNLWEVYKATDSDFQIHDYTRGSTVFEIIDNGNMHLMPNGGSVGIGTTAPGSVFDIQTSNSSSYTSTASGVYAYLPYPQELAIRNNANGGTNSFTGIFFDAGDNSPGSQINAARISAVRDGGFATHLTFGTRNGVGSTAEKLRITSEGNVGIGTTNPNATLHVNGDINVTSGNDICIDGGNCLSGLSGISSSSAGGWSNTSTLISSNVGDNVTIDSGAFFVDATNNRVGIGTTSPLSGLHLHYQNSLTGQTPAASADDFLIDQTGSAGLSIFSGTSASGNIYFGDSASSSIGRIVYGHSNNSLGIWTNSAERLSIDSSGSVGINEASPDGKLHVTETGATSADTLTLEASAGGYTGDLIFGTVNRGDTSAYNLLKLSNTAGNKLLVTGAGNVGIGTTSPLSLLNIESSTPKFTISNSNISISNQQEIGSLAFYARDSSSQGTGEFAKISAIAEATGDWDNVNSENGATGLAFYTTEVSGGTQTYGRRMSILSNGNVGIGTSAPVALLDVSKSQNTASTIRLANANTGTASQSYIQLNNNAVNTYLGLLGSGFTTSAYFRANGTYLRNTGSGLDFAATASTGNIQFWTGGSNQRMIIDSTGNVGIGTTNPNAKLELKGSTSNVSAHALVIRDSSNTALFSIRNDGRVDFKTSSSIYLPSSGIWNSAGSVGIGTISPGSELDVNGSITSTGLIVSSGTVNFPDGSIPGDDIADGTIDTTEIEDGSIGEADLAITNTPGDGEILSYNSSSGTFTWVADATGASSSSAGGWTNTSTLITSEAGVNISADSGVLFVDATNNRVGIGTTTPDSQLQINGASTVSQIHLTNSATGSTGSDGLFLYNSGNEAYIVQKENAGLHLYTNNNEKLTVLTGGNVGIGTTNPSAKLHVNASTGNLIQANNAGGNVFIVNNSGAVFADGGYSTPAADLAERIPVSEDVRAGEVLIIDTQRREMLKKSDKAYDKLVAGVVSTKPGLMLGERGEYVALAGRVPVKVTGAVAIGDLLTTSDEKGKAMRCDIYEKCIGAILGKALTNSKEGEVIALVSLQ